jgi:hypothetical protein
VNVPARRPTLAQVGFADGAPIVVVFVGEYWLCHAEQTDWEHAVGDSARAAVTNFLQREVPRGVVSSVLWDAVDALAA